MFDGLEKYLLYYAFVESNETYLYDEPTHTDKLWAFLT